MPGWSLYRSSAIRPVTTFTAHKVTEHSILSASCWILKMLTLDPVDFLILGAGWTSNFLIPQLKSSSITFAATTTTGHDGTIPFKYEPSSSSTSQYSKLPSAKTVLVAFPLKGEGQSKQITSLYRQVHGDQNNWIQLGSTGIFSASHWNDCSSPYNTENERAVAEDEMLELNGCVLNLAGLYGGERDPKNWVTRVAKTKDEVKGKKGERQFPMFWSPVVVADSRPEAAQLLTNLALHLIHGADVARAIIAVHNSFTHSKRWLLTDLRVYDWWDLIQDWGAKARARASDALGVERAEELQYEKWVGELMEEEGVKALPRPAEGLGRVLDSRAFWAKMGTWPREGRVG